MNPDETKLALWLDDELSGDELVEMDAWAANQPEQLAAREELRSFRNMMSENIPADEELPYPDFFLSRIHQGIREMEAGETKPAASARSKTSFWKSWLMPAAACAGMVLAFGIGRQSSEKETVTAINPPVMQPVVYTPEEGVNAEWSSSAGSTLIVLQGIAAIPDSMDFSETVYIPTARESDRTANREHKPKDTIGQ